MNKYGKLTVGWIIAGFLISGVFNAVLAAPSGSVEESIRKIDQGLKDAGTGSGLVVPTPTVTTGATVSQEPTEKVQAALGSLVGIVVSMAGLIFIVMILYAGLKWMLSNGESGAVKKSKSTMIHAAIGFFVTMIAYQIAKFVIDRIKIVS